MKENLLISIMMKDNSLYVPYFFKCTDLVDKYNTKYNINYIVYTNNNTDNTLQLLNNNSKENIKIVEKTYDKEFLNKPRVERLHYLREDFLNIIRKETFDYLLMVDTDILFNEKMIADSIEILNSNNYGAITANTITYWSPFYYDTFSLSTKNIEYYPSVPVGSIDLTKFNLDTLWNKNKHKSVISAFGGFFLTSSKVINDKKLSYIKGNKKIKENICEHKYFNKQIKNIKFINNINPIWCKGNSNDEKEFKNSFKILEKNNSDNRNFFLIFLSYNVLAPLFIIFLLIFLKNIKYIFQKSYVYIGIFFLISFYALSEIINHKYRLGDVIFNKKINNIFNRTLYKTKWRNSIASEYYSKCTKYEDYDTLYNIVKLKTSIKNIPDSKSLVIHLRTGDTIEYEYTGSIDDLLEGKSDYRGYDGWYYLKDYKFFETNISKLKDLINKVIIVSSFHNTKNPVRSKIYINKIKDYINKLGYDVELRIDKYSPDEDFLYMSNSSYFLRTGGGYSKLINEMVKKNDKISLVENYDDMYR